MSWQDIYASENRLAECVSFEYAQEVVSQAPDAHISMLWYLFDIEDTDAVAVRRRLVQMFAPKARSM